MRYDRQIKLDEVGVAGQEKLQKASVLIVGVGGLGCPAAQYLAGAGIGRIGLIDHDRISLSNLHRQLLFTEEDIGKSKAAVAKQRLQMINSKLEIDVFQESLNVDNAENLFQLYDIILDGTDNFETKYLINDACVLAGKPWVYASIYKNEGQLSVFNYQEGPSYRCLFPKTTKQNISCEETGVLGVTPGIFGIMQAAEILKIILGAGNVLSGKLKLINILSAQDQILSISKRPEEIEKIKNHGIIPMTIECKIYDETKIFLDIREIFEQPKVISEKVIQIPLSELEDRFEEIPKQEEVLVFCQSGKRSKKVVDLLSTAFDFKNLINVEGGVETILQKDYAED
ncbi:HesA/MoeB/ThiF family protein [Gramella sp. MAR_2010_147]|uniref:HesA/MoeB/ThiF family protein n=1 Tax=Gramella sp. MAR_2010_147 TaxID=1250205 RepID=UPI00087D168A|nr:HesA/MoeB/ThiF family protein [Gramella sp. MAR_2010_147]SDR71177.1 adenylyltransferase and sulfurtransferase [Gramella sp. MAR_2010_147]